MNVVSKKIRAGGTAGAGDLLNGNCLIKMMVQTMDQRAELWSRSKPTMFSPDLPKKKKGGGYIQMYL